MTLDEIIINAFYGLGLVAWWGIYIGMGDPAVSLSISPLHSLLLYPISKSLELFLLQNATMASSGRTTAVKGGTGTESTPANNVAGNAARRVSALLSMVLLCKEC